MEIITFSADNMAEVVVLPHTPPGLTVETPQNNETYNGLSMDLNMIGNVGLQSMEISSFFPVRRLPFMPSAAVADPETYINFFDKWRRKHYPIRIVWTKNDGTERLNMPVTVDSFSWAVGKLGDVEYSLSLREYRFVMIGGKLVDNNA